MGDTSRTDEPKVISISYHNIARTALKVSGIGVNGEEKEKARDWHARHRAKVPTAE